MTDLVPTSRNGSPESNAIGRPEPAVDWARLSDATRAFVAEHRYAPNTLRAYERAWKVFLAWCQARARDPRDPHTEAEHLRELAERPSSLAAVHIAHAAIAAGHRLAGTPYDRGHVAISEVLRAAGRSLGRAHPNARHPIVPPLLEQMIAPLGSRAIDLRDRALLVLGFLSALRRSNLVGLEVGDVAFAPRGLDIHVRRSKTDQEGRGLLVSIPKHAGKPDRCAVATLRAWLDAAGVEEGPVFRPVDRWGHVGGAALDPQDVLRIVQRRALAVGLDPERLGGHSLRAGFVTAAAEAGKPLDRIMAQTGHRSAQQVLEYIRRANRYDSNAAEGLLR